MTGLAFPRAILPLILGGMVLLGLWPGLVHLHQDESAGVYNEEHVLAALDSATGEAPLPGGVAPMAVGPAVEPGIPAPAERIFAAPPPHADPRAPPAV